MINAGGFAFSATRDGAIVSEERGVFLFVLRLDRLPTLQLDNREIIGAQLVPIDDLHKVPLTGPVRAYVRGQFSSIDGGAAQSFS